MSFLLATVLTTLTALAVEACIGYPGRIFAAIGHPVTWFGAIITALERSLNQTRRTPALRRGLGVATLVIILLVVVAIAMLLDTLIWRVFEDAAFVVLGMLASTLIAQRSLHDHVRQVAIGLETGIDEGRVAISHIVGRDPQSLDGAGIARAAIESLSENFSDGVVAPTFYLALAGLPGAVAYKTINTADSMVGHRSPRYEAYGWASARLDDVVNLPASRLSALLIIAAAALLPGYSAVESARSVWRDAGRHRSPNAGWPEAAMAGALGLRLAGPRTYAGTVVKDSWMGNGRAEANPCDIFAALKVYRLACAMQAGLLVLILLWLGT